MRNVVEPSTLENIDAAFFEWVNEVMGVNAMTNMGWKKVPVIWANEERAHQVKKDEGFRDEQGVLIFPLIAIRRQEVEKSMDSEKKGAFQMNVPMHAREDDYFVLRRKLNQEKTNNFARAEAIEDQSKVNAVIDNNQPVYQFLMAPKPVHVNVTYQVTLRSNYQQQINQMSAPFMSYPGSPEQFLIERNGHRYECFMDSDFSDEGNISNFDEEERSFKTTFNVRVLGYLMGEGENDPEPKIKTQENAVEVKYEEKIVTGSINNL